MTASSVRSKREKKKKNISSKSVSIYDVVVSFTVLVPFFILIMKAFCWKMMTYLRISLLSVFFTAIECRS